MDKFHHAAKGASLMAPLMIFMFFNHHKHFRQIRFYDIVHDLSI